MADGDRLAGAALAAVALDVRVRRGVRRRGATGVPMNKEMIISSGDHETRVAILEDDQVVEVFIERENQRGVLATSTRAG